MERRQLLATTFTAACTPAIAQERMTYPSRPVTLTVGFPPGAISDIVTRALAQKMSEDLGQTIVVENRPGAGTSLASGHVAGSPPDGYTLLMASNSLATNFVALPQLPPKDPTRDLEPIGLAYRSPFILIVGKTIAAANLAEFLSFARANPGKVNFASSGLGAVNHLALELLKQRADVAMEHIAYRGGAPALVDLRAGRVDAFFATILDAAPLLRNGVARALAVSSPERLPQFPEVPAIAEQVAGYEAVFWQGLLAPAGTGGSIVARLAKALRSATTNAVLGENMRQRGVDLLPGGPEELRTYLEREIAVWGRLIQTVKLRLE